MTTILTETGLERVNTYTYTQIYDQTVTALPDGGYIITWSAGDPDEYGYDIHAQRYDAAGNTVGDEVIVNSTGQGAQTGAVVTSLTDGGFIIAWTSSGHDGVANPDVYYQRYDAAGNMVGTETFVSNTGTYGGVEPSVTGLTDGGYVISWTDLTQTGTDGFGNPIFAYNIYTQRYSAAGAAVGGPVKANLYDAYSFDSQITALGDGGYLLTWTTYSSLTGYDVHGVRYNAAGEGGDEGQINTYASGTQSGAHATALADGGFVITWESQGQDGSGYGVYSQKYNAAGDLVGLQTRVNTTTVSDQYGAKTTALGDGGYVVSWYGVVGSAFGVYVQRFDADGDKLGPEMLVNTFRGIYDFSPSVAALDNGGFVVSWVDYNSLGEYAVYKKEFMATTFLGGTQYLFGTTFGDLLNGGAGIDKMYGGKGNDTYVVNTSLDICDELGISGLDLVESSATYTLGANIENGTLTGTANINLTGNTENNVLEGNTGNNRLNGTTGSDTMTGVLGDDTYDVDSVGDVVNEVAGGGVDWVNSLVTFDATTIHIENITLTGNIAVNAIGNGLNNLLTGNSAGNSLTGGAGHDVLNGMGGADSMTGGTGNDTYYADNLGDIVTEVSGGGTDQVFASVTFTLSNYTESLTLIGPGDINGIGNSLANILAGNNGNNVLSGMGGNDVLTGGETGGGGDITDTGAVFNGDLAHAFAIGNPFFSLASNANIQDSTTAPHATIHGVGNGTLRFYSFNISQAGALAYFDIDNTVIVDTYLRLYDTNGNLLSYDDDSATYEGAGGSTRNTDSFLQYTFSTPGTYIIGVSAFLQNPVTSAMSYDLHISLGNNGAMTWGNDVLDGGLGNDSMAGGLGDDTYIVDGIGDVVTELENQGSDTVTTTVTYTLGDFFENLILGGTANINGTGNGLNNLITGNSGINALNGGAGNDTFIVQNVEDTVTESTGQGTDEVRTTVNYSLFGSVEFLRLLGVGNINGTGNSLANTMYGNAGNNVLDGGSGLDTTWGGAGNDTFVVNNSADVVIESDGEGTDTVQSTAVGFILSDFVENLILLGTGNLGGTGNGLNNILTGNSGNNDLNGMGGTDTMNGGAGNDTYWVYQEGDMVQESSGQGTDEVNSTVTFSLSGGHVEKLILLGFADINAIGNSLANILTGNTGNNLMDGGSGIDTMTGGTGNDTYLVNVNGDTIYEASGGGLDELRSSVSYTVSSNVENLRLVGTANINATGNGSDNYLIGNNGNNMLNGKAGNDALEGGLGADQFLFETGSGLDTINDFSQAENDTINVNAYTHGVAFGGGTVTITQQGGSALINLGGGNVILVHNAVATDPGFLNQITW